MSLFSKFNSSNNENDWREKYEYQTDLDPDDYDTEEEFLEDLYLADTENDWREKYSNQSALDPDFYDTEEEFLEEFHNSQMQDAFFISQIFSDSTTDEHLDDISNKSEWQVGYDDEYLDTDDYESEENFLDSLDDYENSCGDFDDYDLDDNSDFFDNDFGDSDFGDFDFGDFDF